MCRISVEVEKRSYLDYTVSHEEQLAYPKIYLIRNFPNYTFLERSKNYLKGSLKKVFFG
jgi:hypothetical protein